MFGWNSYNAKPIGYNGKNFDPSAYSFEGDGHFAAMEDAATGFSAIDIAMAQYNSVCINIYSNAFHRTNGNEDAALEAVNEFRNSTAVTEGFLSDLKEKLISLLTKIKEKIIAFFKSAVRYFDEFFMDAAKFAEKYEDEVTDKDLDKLKYKVFEYKIDKPDKQWDVVLKEAKSVNSIAGRFSGVGESYNFDQMYFEQTINVGDDDQGVYASKEPGPDGKPEYAFFGTGDQYNDDSWVFVAHPSQDAINSMNKYNKEKYDKWKNGGSSNPSQPNPVNNSDKISSLTSQEQKEIRSKCFTALAGESISKDEQFRKAIRKRLQGGKNEAKEVEVSSILTDVISGLKEYKDVLDDIEETRDKITEEYDKLIDAIKTAKDTENAKNASTEKDNNIMKLNNGSKILNIVKNCFMTYFDVYKTVVKERTNAYKSVLGAALHYTAPKS